jgi:hypothetical protein
LGFGDLEVSLRFVALGDDSFGVSEVVYPDVVEDMPVEGLGIAR